MRSAPLSQINPSIQKLKDRNWQLKPAAMPLERIALASVFCFFAAQTVMVPVQAADWGYDNDFANDKEPDPKFSDHKSNIKAPLGRDPMRQADEPDADSQVGGPPEELDAAPATLNSAKNQKTGAKPVGKTGTKPGITGAKQGTSTKTTPVKTAPGAQSNFNSDVNGDSEFDSNASAEQGQNSDSERDANLERDPVYREGITLPPSAVPVDQQKKIINAWLNLFGLVSPLDEKRTLPKGPDYTSQLSDEQKARFTVTLKKMLASKEQAGYKQIENYWSALTRLLQDVDHRSNYRVLFRSLLSMRADAPDISQDERDMLHEALGPKRIAEIGPPPLTEDAIDAYTDMTCFLYEQSHPGKTVDADDNRALYGMIVRDKFKKAPTDHDRMAMNQFPLSWAKFRILYTDANPSEKVLLAERIASEQGTRGLGIRNVMLEQVLSTPVWRRFVVGSNKVMVTSNTAGGKTKSRTAGGAGRPTGSGGNASKSFNVGGAGGARPLDTADGGGSAPAELDASALSLKSGGTPAKKPLPKPGGSTAKPKRP
jgi:hypothetical protein